MTGNVATAIVNMGNIRAASKGDSVTAATFTPQSMLSLRFFNFMSLYFERATPAELKL